jgi:hypothetical protein
MTRFLNFALQVAAVGQITVALLNLRLVPLLNWQKDVAVMPLLLRQVFYVHAWFISASLFLFGALTFRFSERLAAGADPLARWLAAGIGLFWTFRAILQVTYYSSSHWRGQRARTFVHGFLLLIYGGMAVVYVWAALGGKT